MAFRVDLFTFIALGALALVPLWVHLIWKSLRSLIEYWEGKDKRSEETARIDWPRSDPSPWILRKRVLFFIGTLFLLAGFLLTISFKNRAFIPLIVAGILFLSLVFFYCYFSTYSKGERALLRARPNRELRQSGVEELLLFTPPVWFFDAPSQFLSGLFFQFLGIAFTYIYEDVFCLLLNVFGVAFLLQVWSFYQLNVLVVTNRRIILKQVFPDDRTMEILHAQVRDVQIQQDFSHRLCRVGGRLVISSPDQPDLAVVLQNPKTAQDLISDRIGR